MQKKKKEKSKIGDKKNGRNTRDERSFIGVSVFDQNLGIYRRRKIETKIRGLRKLFK